MGVDVDYPRTLLLGPALGSARSSADELGGSRAFAVPTRADDDDRDPDRDAPPRRKSSAQLMHEHLLIGYPGSDVDW